MLARIDHTYVGSPTARQKWMIAGIVTFAVVLSGCSGGGGTVRGTASASPSPLTVTAVYPTSSGISWSPIMLSNRYYIKGLSVSVTGTCDHGIATIEVNEGAGNYAETANCQSDGSFSWNKTYTGPLDVDKTLNLAGYDTSGTLISGTSVSTNVHIDNVAPAAPTVTTPATSSYTHSGGTGNFTFAGTVSADTYRLTVNGSTLAFTGTSFSYPTIFADGSTTVWTFNAFDLAGNQSTATTITVMYAPSVKYGLNVDNDISGGLVTDGVTSYTLESASFMMPSTTTHGGSSFSLDTGFNYITNSERAN